ncbi:DDE-domain-containing protein [Choiromyces venosus 120613-1]|uniref:DDE-domain-containing protein n=1 Tax=Choiromyces venosus 120613-1 TaxID=1336337 RepID=A0A3N4J204_9PEZI|nr:DDE-domain-containing protein [Choiromyces venosus 120613-1]
MREFFNRFDMVQARYGNQQEDMWNVDEHGIALGVCVNTCVIGKVGKKRTYIQSPETCEWVSIIETISATSKYIRPIVIFKGQNVQTSWFEEDNLPNWLIAMSGKGWTTNEIGIQWKKWVELCNDNYVVLVGLPD